jgi:hypothetical protein
LHPPPYALVPRCSDVVAGSGFSVDLGFDDDDDDDDDDEDDYEIIGDGDMDGKAGNATFRSINTIRNNNDNDDDDSSSGYNVVNDVAVAKGKGDDLRVRVRVDSFEPCFRLLSTTGFVRVLANSAVKAASLSSSSAANSAAKASSLSSSLSSSSSSSSSSSVSPSMSMSIEVVVTEGGVHWIGCDEPGCGKWRRVPSSVSLDEFFSSFFLCLSFNHYFSLHPITHFTFSSLLLHFRLM